MAGGRGSWQLEKEMAGDFKDLMAYKKGFQLAMGVYELSKTFPVHEKYSLTDQIRRSSRSICANIAEAYRKRRYPAHFVSKLTDSDAENSETQVWLSFSLACQYISQDEHDQLTSLSQEVGRLIAYMISNSVKFCPQALAL